MKLALIGNYGATNVGDDAILEALLKLFSKHQITVFSANPALTKKKFKVPSAHLFPLGIRSIFKFKMRESVKSLKHSQAVVLGGGGLFQDDNWYACFLWAWQVFWVKKFKKPLFICATGVGPLKTKWGKRLTRWAYRQATMITVRDEASKSTLSELGFNQHEINVVADPTFSTSLKGTLEKEGLTEKKQLFISIRDWLDHTPTILRVMTEFLTNLKQEGWEFTFVAMQSIQEEDQSILKMFISQVGGKLFIPQSFSELLQEMSQADAAVGMRYHFLIAALLTNTPFIPIAYSPKVSQLVVNTPLEPYLIPVQKLDLNQLQSNFERLIGQVETTKKDQVDRLKGLKQFSGKNQNYFQAFIDSII